METCELPVSFGAISGQRSTSSDDNRCQLSNLSEEIYDGFTFQIGRITTNILFADGSSEVITKLKDVN